MLHSRRFWLTALRCAAAGIALLLFARVLLAADARQVSRLVAGLGIGSVVLVALPQLLSIALESFGWKLLFRAGGQRPRFFALLRVRLATEALAQSLPLGVAFAESIKPLLLGRHAGLAVEQSLAGMTARKVLILIAQAGYVLTFAALGFIGLERVSHTLAGAPHLGFVALGAGLALAVGGGILFAMLRRSALARGVFALLARLPSARLRGWLATRERAFASTDGAVSALFRADARQLLHATLFFGAGWVMESVETWLLLHVLGAPTSFVTAASIEIVLSLVRNIVFVVPAGLGVQDLGYVSGFAAFGVPGPAAIGAAFVLLKRGKELFWIAVGYALLGSEMRMPETPFGRSARRVLLRLRLARA